MPDNDHPQKTSRYDPEKWRGSRVPEATLKRLTELREAGHSFPAMAATLTQEQIPSSTGKTVWTTSMVRQSLLWAGVSIESGTPRPAAQRGRPRRVSDELLDRMVQLRDEGKPYRVIAETLNAEEYRTPHMRQWTKSSVAHQLAVRPPARGG